MTSSSARSLATPTVIIGAFHSPNETVAATLAAGQHVAVGPVVLAGAEIVDGVVVAAPDDTTDIVTRYQRYGAEGLPAGVALFDESSGRLTLTGPLYYVESNGGVIFADAPAELIRVGAVQATANDEAVMRFLATGACDEGDVTFFAGVKRVPAGYALRCEPGSVALSPLRGNHAVPEQVDAVRFGGGIFGADVVAGAPDAKVYRASFGPLDRSEDEYATRALAVLEVADAVAVPVDADALAHDLDEFVEFLGEPVADPATYVVFALARAAASDGAVTMVDPVVATHLAARKPVSPSKVLASLTFAVAPVMDRVSVWRRVAHRLRTLGISVATPFLDDPEREPTVAAAAARVVGGARDTAPVRDWLLRLKNRMYELFHSQSFVERPWFNELAIREAFEGFIKGRNTDAELFWRIILVELWARRFLDATGPTAQVERPVKGALDPNHGKNLEITVDGAQWARVPIRTELFDKGDPIAAKICDYAVSTVALMTERPDLAAGLNRPWYLMVSEKIVAIAQGRSYFVWEIEPSWWARTLSKYVVKTPYGIGLGSPWTMQLAIDEAGLPRILFASVVGAAGKLVGRRGLFYQLAGNSVRAIDGPTEYSVYPANVSAKLPPARPSEVAAEVAAALRDRLAADGLDQAAAMFAGCVVIDANDIGRNVLGMAADRPEKFFEELFADNPLGQGSEQTPLAIAIPLAE